MTGVILTGCLDMKSPHGYRMHGVHASRALALQQARQFRSQGFNARVITVRPDRHAVYYKQRETKDPAITTNTYDSVAQAKQAVNYFKRFGFKPTRQGRRVTLRHG
jgi:hypothetical protein